MKTKKKRELTEKEIKKHNKRYKNYPNFIKTSINRPKEYNKTLEYIKKLEDKKKIFVIRPSKNIEINPLKKTVDDLDKIYNLGIDDTKKKYKDLIEFLK